MKREAKFFGDLWTRFDRYEIRDGYIRPAPNARKVEYEPWSDYAPPKGKTGTERPYHSLVKLVERLERRPDPFKPLGQEHDEEILHWCREHGLLGVLLHRVEMATFVQAPGTGFGPRIRFQRTTRGWQCSEPIFDLKGIPDPGVVIRDLGSFNWRIEPESETWATFFPDISGEHKVYPTPTSDEFWAQYGERVEVFLEAAHKLKQAVDELQKLSNPAKLDEREWLRWSRAETTIHALTSPVRPFLYPQEDDAFGLGWACYSLLSIFAMMASLDLVESRQLRCQVCERMFVSKAVQAKYCSSRCRATEQMRRYRKKKAKEKRRVSNVKKKTRTK